MSPGRAGAMVTSPESSALKVLMKKLSPPSSERLRPLRTPPRTPVVSLMESDMETMAPASAWMFSPDASWMTQSA